MTRVLGRVGDLVDRLRSSFFYVPALFILGALVLARATTWLDAMIDYDASVLLRSVVIRSTADGARAILGTTAGATITVAGIVFSVTMLSVQLASSQFSPRVLDGFLRDRFKQNVMGLMVGTFTYCLLVLAVVRRQFSTGSEAAEHRLAVTVAVALGVIAILAIVAFVDQSARSLQVGQIIRRITDETMERVRQLHPEPHTPTQVDGSGTPLPDGEGWTVRADSDGWVQRVDAAGLFGAAAEGGVVRLDTRVGAFVSREQPLATIWPEPEDHDGAIERVRSSIVRGRTRTLRQDVAFGIRQLVDIAVRALSPGVNDPTTANEALVHLGGLVREILLRDLPDRVRTDDKDRRLFRPHDLDRNEYVTAAFSEIRFAAANSPTVLATLIRVLRGLDEIVRTAEHAERTGQLRREARLTVETAERAGLESIELERIHDLAEPMLKE